jgi:hypothetical protein
VEVAESVTMPLVTETNPLAEVFSKFWADLSPRSRALFMRSIASYFGVGEPPAHPIFHYASADAFVNILRRREIWATNAAYLNDANELSYPVTLAHQVLDDLAKEEADADLKSFVHDVAHDVGTHQVYKAWYVASFSSDGNLLSQWRAYCPRGGFSIGFDPARLTGVLKGISGLKFGPVLYDKNEQVARIRAVVADQLNTFRSLRSDPNWMAESYSAEMRLYLALAVGETLIFCKSEAFREEAEWRIAKYDFADGGGLQFRERLGLLTPFQTIQLAPEGGRLPLHRMYLFTV